MCLAMTYNLILFLLYFVWSTRASKLDQHVCALMFWSHSWPHSPLRIAVLKEVRYVCFVLPRMSIKQERPPLYAFVILQSKLGLDTMLRTFSPASSVGEGRVMLSTS